MYYLRSRYYNVDWYRFINADKYIDGGSLNNLFTYCCSSPVRFIDPNGTIYQFDGYSYGDDEERGGYRTAHEAAIAFYNEFYLHSYYVRIEYGGMIYTREIEGELFYFYSQPLIGEAHRVAPHDLIIDNGVTIVAYVHTHPNSDDFSDNDIKYADGESKNFYVVGPSFSVQFYDYMNKSISTLETLIQPNELSQIEKSYLVELCKDKWDRHWESDVCIFGCKNMVWPTEIN